MENYDHTSLGTVAATLTDQVGAECEVTFDGGWYTIECPELGISSGNGTLSAALTGFHVDIERLDTE